MISLSTLMFIYAIGLGACVGSFLNVVIARLPADISIIKPRSRCPKCEVSIAWYDNIPVFSYLFLRARCRHCRAPISFRYPLVEMLCAALASALLVRFGPSFELLTWLPITFALVAITFLDLDHFWIPDSITYPSMLYAGAAAFLPGGITPIDALIGLVPAVSLWAFAWLFERIFRKEGLGLGDVKLLALIGLGLGALPTLTVLFLGAVQGSVIGMVILALGGHTRQAPPPKLDDGWTPHPRAIPFGPFLVLGCLEILLLPEWFNNLPMRIALQLTAP